MLLRTLLEKGVLPSCVTDGVVSRDLNQSFDVFVGDKRVEYLPPCPSSWGGCCTGCFHAPDVAEAVWDALPADRPRELANCNTLRTEEPVLLIAVRRRAPDGNLVAKLLACGADSAVRHKGRTAAHRAMQGGIFEVLKLLKDAGAPLDVNPRGTPMDKVDYEYRRVVWDETERFGVDLSLGTHLLSLQ